MQAEVVGVESFRARNYSSDTDLPCAAIHDTPPSKEGKGRHVS